MAYELKINDAELAKSAVTYRKELLTMPVIAAQATLQHMSARPATLNSDPTTPPAWTTRTWK